MQDNRRNGLDELLARLADGDREAFRPLFLAAWPVVRDYCRRALGDGFDADDAAQQAMHKLFEQASDYDASRPAIAWMLAIAAWECRTIRRKHSRSRRTGMDGLLNAEAAGPSPEEEAIACDLVAALREVRGGLRPEDQAALRQAFDDLEEECGPVSPAQRKRKERALNRLRAAWRMIHGS
ncbi:MAG: hypothetical protein GMKNLPBB_01039 [Myxococcota bacterium]|nr:hypothetical protein [Myxococcota bacterium]